MDNIYIWQQVLWKRLAQARQFSGHALLLKGRAGIGKAVFAQNLARFLLCELSVKVGEACGNCQSCIWFSHGEHPDFCQLEPEVLSALSSNSVSGSKVADHTSATRSKKKLSQQINVNQVRALDDFVYLSSHQNSYKVILICPAESMNPAAANALLKKLEEPPPQVLFILVSHCPQHLLPTIRSRCHQIAMPVPDVKISTEWLKQQGVNSPEDCLAAASFAPLLALTFNTPDYTDNHNAFIAQISQPAQLNPLVLAEKMQYCNFPSMVCWMQKWCYDLLSFRSAGTIRYYLSQQDKIQILATKIDSKALLVFASRLVTAQRLSRHPLNARLFLEEILLCYAELISANWNEE